MKYRLLTSIIAITTLVGCSGEMTGQVRGTGERVTFAYEQGLDHDKYTAVIGNETFVGKAVMDGASATIGNSYGNFGGQFGTTTMYGMGLTNRFVAVLLGNKGNSLNCQMRYADSTGETSSGGVGVCQHTDGRIIDVVW